MILRMTLFHARSCNLGTVNLNILNVQIPYSRRRFLIKRSRRKLTVNDNDTLDPNSPHQKLIEYSWEVICNFSAAFTTYLFPVSKHLCPVFAANKLIELTGLVRKPFFFVELFTCSVPNNY